jgi:hypothetical protein
MIRVDRIASEGSNSGVGQLGPIVRPEVSPFDGVRDVAADIPTESGVGGWGATSVAAHIRSSEPAGDGQAGVIVAAVTRGHCTSHSVHLKSYHHRQSGF